MCDARDTSSTNSFQTEKQAREQTKPGEHFAVLAVREAARGQEDALLVAVDELMQRARRAPGFVYVDVLQPFDEPAVVVQYEMWAGKPAHDAFDAGPIHATFSEQVAPLLAHHNIPLHYRLYRRYVGMAGTASATPDSTTDGPRVPLLDPAETPPDTQAVFRSLPAPLAIFRALAHAETVFPPLMDVARVILTDMALPRHLRELVILHVGQLSGARYEWEQHAPLARHAQVTGEQEAALGRGDEDAACFSPMERAVLRFTREALESATVTDETFAAVRVSLSPREVVELLIVVGFYRTMCTVMRSVRLPLDPAIDKPWAARNSDTATARA